MPVNFPEFSGTGDPREPLKEFVRQVRDFLAEIVRSNRDPVRSNDQLFEPELLSDMRAAWAEVQTAGHFDDIERRIGAVTDQTTWSDHGLNGMQLRFKLAVIRFFHGLFITRGAENF
jgi:hypothetical protein